jgi:hypothetical protein
MPEPMGPYAAAMRPLTGGVDMPAYRRALSGESQNLGNVGTPMDWAMALAPGPKGANPEPIASVAARAAEMQPIKAYHGSPYDFEKFDLSKIGTGEGAQAYGHGLYFAENPAVAESYKMESHLPLKYEGKRFGPYPETQELPYGTRSALEWLVNTHKPGETSAQVIDRRIAELKDHADFMRHSSNPQDRQSAFMYDNAVENLRSLDPSKLELQKGKMYEVGISADSAHFLDWDKPLSEQHPKVQEVFGQMVDRPDMKVLKEYLANKGEEPKGHTIYRALGNVYNPNVSNEGVNAMEQLRAAGIPGIKYLDQGSRVSPLELQQARSDAAHWEKMTGEHGFNSAWTPEGLAAVRQKLADVESKAARQTSNYVVFDDNLINIIRKYGIAAVPGLAAAAGTAGNGDRQ